MTKNLGTPQKKSEQEPNWNLRLYIAGQTPRSLEALANLKQICDEYLKDRHTIEVIDLQQNPAIAEEDDIIAIPTLIRKLPEPLRKIIGTLRDTERVLVGLEITARVGKTG